VIVLLAATASGSDARAGGLRLAKIATLDAPVYLDSPPGSKGLLFVVQQTGEIRVIRNGKLLGRPFLDLRDRVLYDGSEQGMYSVAFDPDYANNRRFYVYYVNRDGNIEVDTLRRSKDRATRATGGSRRTVITIDHPNAVYQNGGQLRFGPDGFLYLGTGDGENAGNSSPGGNSQDTQSLLGKLLRIDPEPKGGYRVPESNPYGGEAGQPEIYAIGLRNPFRFSFDPRNGDLYLGDVGDSSWEEIDRVDRLDLSAANFGWKLFEGTLPRDGNGVTPPNYVPPVFEYRHTGNNCAVLGGVLVHSNSLAQLDGRYLYADVCVGDVRSFAPSKPDSTDRSTGMQVKLPTSITQPADGHVYITSLAGAVYRVKERR
jgi:glucose/arabinose dehydrogenase